jgi:protein phosphatase
LPVGRANIVVRIRTDRGCEREINEDSGLCIRPEGELLASRGVLTIVADGMGGHAAGEVASRMAVESIGRLYYERKGDFQNALIEAFELTNRGIYERAQQDEVLEGMGTTCTALAVCGDYAYSAHVGDSRLYLLRERQMYVMTEDHSEVMERVRHGLMSVEEARRHADRNIILRSLGSRPEIVVAAWQEPMPVLIGDRFILCSDGLHDVVSDQEMKHIMADMPEPAGACEALIELARTRGGPDNITAAIVSVNSPETQNVGQVRETRETGVVT